MRAMAAEQGAPLRLDPLAFRGSSVLAGGTCLQPLQLVFAERARPWTGADDLFRPESGRASPEPDGRPLSPSKFCFADQS